MKPGSAIGRPEKLRGQVRRAARLGPFLLALFLAPPWPVHAEDALVAVAANFFDVMRRLEADFERSSGHDLNVTTGSTGKLYAQIRHGAPYDLFLAADQRRPALLESEGDAVPGSRFTYAKGRLVLWSADRDRMLEGGEAALRSASLRLVAIANPDLAPYGAAAREVLQNLGVWTQLQGRVAFAENVGQAYALVASGNADLGLLALSSLQARGDSPSGSRWLVPDDLHSPIRQDAVLLERAAQNPVARSFFEYLQGPAARALIESFGYSVE